MMEALTQTELNQELVEACCTRQYTLAKTLLERGANVHTRNDEPLCVVSQTSDIDFVKLLLSYGANPERGLQIAIYEAWFDVASLLLEHCSHLSKDDPSIWYISGRDQRFARMIPKLVKLGIDVDYDNGRALKAALEMNNAVAVYCLITSGAKVNYEMLQLAREKCDAEIQQMVTTRRMRQNHSL